jgi:hypothetical protein
MNLFIFHAYEIHIHTHAHTHPFSLTHYKIKTTHCFLQHLLMLHHFNIRQKSKVNSLQWFHTNRWYSVQANETKQLDNLFHMMPQHSWYESVVIVPLTYTYPKYVAVSLMFYWPTVSNIYLRQVHPQGNRFTASTRGLQLITFPGWVLFNENNICCLYIPTVTHTCNDLDDNRSPFALEQWHIQFFYPSSWHLTSTWYLSHMMTVLWHFIQISA